MTTKPDLLDYGTAVRKRRNALWQGAGHETDFAQPGKVYYGEVTLLEVLERTGWHAGQHARQLMLILEKLGIGPDRPLTGADFAGLPMPEQVWDNEKPWN